MSFTLLMASLNHDWNLASCSSASISAMLSSSLSCIIAMSAATLLSSSFWASAGRYVLRSCFPISLTIGFSATVLIPLYAFLPMSFTLLMASLNHDWNLASCSIASICAIRSSSSASWACTLRRLSSWASFRLLRRASTAARLEVGAA